jgi:hypothetical protein
MLELAKTLAKTLQLVCKKRLLVWQILLFTVLPHVAVRTRRAKRGGRARGLALLHVMLAWAR